MDGLLTLAPSALVLLVLWRLKVIEAKQDRDSRRIRVLETLVTALCINAGIDISPLTGG